jgi:hypothetical protein
MSDQSFNDAQNKFVRMAEERYPGYKGPVYGQFTPGKDTVQLPSRTQIGFDDGTVYWLDVPAGSVLVGDRVCTMENCRFLTVTSVGMTLSGDMFDENSRNHLTVPYRVGTFLTLTRGSNG